jgi:hypothetical protein
MSKNTAGDAGCVNTNDGKDTIQSNVSHVIASKEGDRDDTKPCNGYYVITNNKGVRETFNIEINYEDFLKLILRANDAKNK